MVLRSEAILFSGFKNLLIGMYVWITNYQIKAGYDFQIDSLLLLLDLDKSEGLKRHSNKSLPS